MASAGEKRGKSDGSSCTRCRDAHSACDQGQPCGRCARTGCAHLCVYVPRKSGRSSSSSSFDALGHPNLPASSFAPPFPSSSAFSSSTPQQRKRSPSDDQSEAGAVARMLEAVEQLTAQVRGLKSSYTGMQEQMAVMHASQQHTNYLVNRLFSDEKRRQQQQLAQFESDSSFSYDAGPGGSPLQSFARKRARVGEGIPIPSVPLNSRSTFFETERAVPSLAREWRLMEARREVPFLAQYDLPEDFAITDFRYPVMGLHIHVDSLYAARAPTMIYANQAFCEFVGYSHEDLVGSPMTKCIAASNRQSFVTSEVRTTKAWSVSPRYRIGPVMRTRSGFLWRTYDNTHFFFDHLGTMKYVLSVTCRWEEGRMKPWESFDEWLPLVARFQPLAGPPIPLSSSPPSSSSSSQPRPDPFATSYSTIIVSPALRAPPTEDLPPWIPPPQYPSATPSQPPPKDAPLHVYPSDLWQV